MTSCWLRRLQELAADGQVYRVTLERKQRRSRNRPTACQRATERLARADEWRSNERTAHLLDRSSPRDPFAKRIAPAAVLDERTSSQTFINVRLEQYDWLRGSEEGSGFQGAIRAERAPASGSNQTRDDIVGPNARCAKARKN